METTLRVLVIDDEPDVLMLCRVNLELAGHEVIEATNGRRASSSPCGSARTWSCST